MYLSPHTRLGPYEIVSAIGAGGMGEFYRTRDTRLDRTVAVKILPEHISAKHPSRSEGAGVSSPRVESTSGLSRKCGEM